MIQVKVTGNIQSIEVTGHANAGTHGNDLVCAGASSIIFGSLNAIDQLYFKTCQFEVNENKIKIKVLKNSDALQKSLQFLLIQLETMEESYPKHIKITRKEV